MIDRPRKDVRAIVRDGSIVDRAIESARERVIRRHKQLGVPLVVWRNGRVVEVAPDSVPTPDES